MSRAWFAETVEGGHAIFRIGREGQDLIAEWPTLGTLVVDRAATAPRFEPVEGADPALIEKVKAGAVRALLRHLRGELTLHASAIVEGEAAIAFIGDSGAGKSTLAFELSSAEGRASALLSDDCLFVDNEGLAHPTESIAWLQRGGNKMPVVSPRVAQRAVPLRMVVQLAFGDTIGVRRLRGFASASVLNRAIVRFVMDEPDVHRADLNRLADLAALVEVVELQRPRGFEHWTQTIAALEKALRA